MSAERQKKRIAEFLTKEKSRLVNYVSRWVQDTAERDGEDIVQDVMLNIFDSTDITAPVENPASYVYRSLYNRAVDMLRKPRRTVPLGIDHEPDRSFLDVLSDIRYDAHGAMEKKELWAPGYSKLLTGLTRPSGQYLSPQSLKVGLSGSYRTCGKSP
ncbi:MAG TPA: hypothetical protein ENI15_00565 [Spirochaetes bacterium]|nr:hypothetical protein [Spirochaetota bacterium]